MILMASSTTRNILHKGDNSWLHSCILISSKFYENFISYLYKILDSLPSLELPSRYLYILKLLMHSALLSGNMLTARFPFKKMTHNECDETGRHAQLVLKSLHFCQRFPQPTSYSGRDLWGIFNNEYHQWISWNTYNLLFSYKKWYGNIAHQYWSHIKDITFGSQIN